MADDGDDAIGRAMMLAGGDRYRDPVRDVVEGDEVNPRYTEVRSAQGPIQSPLGWNEPLANRLPSGAMDVLAGLIGPRAPVRVPNPIKAYHGSPHDFDAFDLSKIGTGEGAQAYGHGLYFAEHEPVAQSYKQESSLPLKYEGRRFGPYPEAEDIPYSTKGALEWLVNTAKPGETSAQVINRRIAELQEHADFMRRSSNRADRDTASTIYEPAIERLRGLDPAKLELQRGRMYEVALHASPESFLDWDKPLSGQSDPVKAAVDKAYERGVTSGYGLPYRVPLRQENSGGDALTSIANAFGHGKKGQLARDHEGASEALREAGLHGIRYLDQGSRGIDRGTSNYVVWSPEIIEILRKYGIILGPAAALGLATQDKTQQ